jgi:hypothetical protein
MGFSAIDDSAASIAWLFTGDLGAIAARSVGTISDCGYGLAGQGGDDDEGGGVEHFGFERERDGFERV